MRIIVLNLVWVAVTLPALATEDRNEAGVAHIRIDSGHPWRPPFGLERVGQPLTLQVEINSAAPGAQKYSLTGYLEGRQIGDYALPVAGQFPSTNRVTFASWPDELVLSAIGTEGKLMVLARETLRHPGFEADAIARPDSPINPVDLGTVLVPYDWLLLGRGQMASVAVAAICRTNDIPGALATAWFESRPRKRSAINIELARNGRAQVNLPLPAASAKLGRDVLHVIVVDSTAKELWHKKIPTMLVHKPPQWPAFGARETKLRYDPPISLLNRETGELSSMPYSNGWPRHLNDVVVSLPNGSRFVFWRGSSYVPFWAGRNNTGLSYEWAETGPLPEGFVDSVEPLMDKELRYGRVKIVESTPARVHVRWSYQSCDFTYKVWGDSADEDFYFYPDGFGTRVLTLKSALGSDYEVSEFIILTPQSAYPFEVLPPDLIELLSIDGQQRRQLFFPYQGLEKSRGVPIVYRVRLHKDEAATAIYFNPNDKHHPENLVVFRPFFDHGLMVTPAYWGSHWPLGRGKTTGATIDNRICVSPAHNSLMSWARKRPDPISLATLDTIDTLGRSKPMTVQRWAWLIGMTDAPDERLLQCANSFARPPSLEVKGARFDINSYVPERRAMRLIVEENAVTIRIKPAVRCVNPVFELLDAPGILARVTLRNRPLNHKEYAWDGRTLWLNTQIDEEAQLQLEFRNSSR